MKRLALTQLLNECEEIKFVEWEDGSYTKIQDETETESSLEELQELVNTGKYEIYEMTF